MPYKEASGLVYLLQFFPALCGSVGPFKGLVAAPTFTAQGWSMDSVITSLNATWMPELAVAYSEITTFMDSRWGRHEYSHWPQQFTHEGFHIYCIPAAPRVNGPREILWQTFSLQDWESDNCGTVSILSSS